MSFDPLSNVSHILQAISKRQEMTSNNLANAYTPGYTAKSASFADLIGDTTSPFSTVLSQKMGTSEVMNDNASTGLPVDIQKEMIEMQKNNLYYTVATRRASTIFNTLRTAAQIGR